MDIVIRAFVIFVSTLVILTVLVSWISFRVPVLRPLLDGKSLVLVEDGKTVERNLRCERITIEELAAQARMQQIASIADVR